MQESRSRGPDWLSIVLVLLLLQTASTRLVVTRWTEFLIFAQGLTTLGTWLGCALGLSRFKKRAVLWLAGGYSLLLVPWQLTLAIQGDVPLAEKLLSVGGRLWFALGQFTRREAVEDGLLFVAFISTVLWALSLVSTYAWTRHNHILTAVLPGGVFIVTIQLYDAYDNRRILLVGIYLLLALILLGRMVYLKNRETWRARRVFQMQDAAYDLTRGIVLAATIFILSAWTIPASAAGWQSAVQTWSRITKPWREMSEWFSNAVEALEGTSGRGSADLYGNQLTLGTGTPLAETVLFTVKPPDESPESPRYYWRGFVYHLYQDGGWYNTFPTNQEFEPAEQPLPLPHTDGRSAARFTITTQIRQSLLYVPAQPSWVSRPGEIRISTIPSGELDVAAWFADPGLAAGERFEAQAVLANPSIQDLQAAGDDYPDWVLETYLQLPEEFSPRVRALAEEITTGLDTPYQKTVAITNYLRREIEYANPLPETPPREGDLLEWVLFDAQAAFCNYYATAEVVMLRAIGIPARMAVGFAQGEFDPETGSYTVRSRDAHAWPEVYFPEVGWIEFEPTGNQAALVRPNRPEALQDPALGQREEPRGELGGLDGLGLPGRGDVEEAEFIPTGSNLPRVQGPLVPVVLAALLAALLWGLNRRYTLVEQIPSRLQAMYARNGVRPPAWIDYWARWNTLTPIERAYQTINHSLRLLGEAPEAYRTAGERGNALAGRLPDAARPIKTLVNQHQAALFTRQPGHARLARRASFAVWLHTARALLARLSAGLDARLNGRRFG